MHSTSENADNFTAPDEIYLVFFYFMTESTTLLFSGRFSFDLTSSLYLLGITLGVHKVCTKKMA